MVVWLGRSVFYVHTCNNCICMLLYKGNSTIMDEWKIGKRERMVESETKRVKSKRSNWTFIFYSVFILTHSHERGLHRVKNKFYCWLPFWIILNSSVKQLSVSLTSTDVKRVGFYYILIFPFNSTFFCSVVSYL